MHTRLIPVQQARAERFGGIANAIFYRDFINTGRLKTLKRGTRRYTTDAWCNECIAHLADELFDHSLSGQ